MTQIIITLHAPAHLALFTQGEEEGWDELGKRIQALHPALFQDWGCAVDIYKDSVLVGAGIGSIDLWDWESWV